jgi:hypothetical protein
LFTDRTDLTDEEIIFGYRGQHQVEQAFRDRKDRYFISFFLPAIRPTTCFACMRLTAFSR